MLPDRDPSLDLDERTARLGREWFAELRQREREEKAAAKRRRSEAAPDDAGLLDWLCGDGDAGDGGD